MACNEDLQNNDCCNEINCSDHVRDCDVKECEEAIQHGLDQFKECCTEDAIVYTSGDTVDLLLQVFSKDPSQGGILIDADNLPQFILKDSYDRVIGTYVSQRISIGVYTYKYTVPNPAYPGVWVARWSYTVNGGNPPDPYNKNVSCFKVVQCIMNCDAFREDSGYFGITVGQIHVLRVHLHDDNPDVDYNFSPPDFPDLNFTSRKSHIRRYIWNDEKLALALIAGTSRFNGHYPPTYFTPANMLFSIFSYLFLNASMIEALKMVSLKWIANEFDFSIGGNSLAIDKSTKYNEIWQTLDSTIEEQIENAKTAFKYRSRSILLPTTGLYGTSWSWWNPNNPFPLNSRTRAVWRGRF